MNSYGEVPLGVESAWPALQTERAARVETKDYWTYTIALAIIVAVVALAGCSL